GTPAGCGGRARRPHRAASTRPDRAGRRQRIRARAGSVGNSRWALDGTDVQVNNLDRHADRSRRSRSTAGAIIARQWWEKHRVHARAAEGANARNRSGPIPPDAANTLERLTGPAGTGAEGARSTRSSSARFQTL